MSLSNEDILKVAKLSKLEIKESEFENLKKELNEILDFVETLNEVETEGVEPLIYVHDNLLELREDLVKPSLTPHEATKNAAVVEEDGIVVPKVISE